MTDLTLRPGKKLYFASDFHLGSAPIERSALREKQVVRWLEQIRVDAQAIYLVGDIFDFWHEYRTAIPKGFVRFLGKLVELKDSGIDIQIFTGNHDIWMNDYFPNEFGIPVHHQPIAFSVQSAKQQKNFYVGHGDGLGPGDYGYKHVLKPIFTNPVLQFLFRWLHPDVGITLAHTWARHTRASKAGKPHEFFKAADTEWIYQYCREIEAQQHHDYYVFGHRHLVLDMPVAENSRYVNLGEWMYVRSYAVYDGQDVRLQIFENDPNLLIPANRK
ncbi:MAG: UDP-2,3-diacylglucosamine diphosphatase [Siphonobacter sp.]